MYIVAINGSPNKDGNCAFLLNEIKKHCGDVDFENVDGDLDFVNNVDGVNITYESSNPAVISNDGVVTKQREVQYVQVGVTFECNGSTGYKVYNFVVLAKGYDTLNEVKNFNEGQEVYVKATVAAVINGTTKNVPVGFYLYDGTDAIYVYSYDFAEVVEAGDEVIIEGNFTKKCYNYPNRKPF